MQVFRIDIIRNVGVRNHSDDIPLPTASDQKLYHRLSLPNIIFKSSIEMDAEKSKMNVSTNLDKQEPTMQSLKQNHNTDLQDEECAISGRLEIRVIPQGLY